MGEFKNFLNEEKIQMTKKGSFINTRGMKIECVDARWTEKLVDVYKGNRAALDALQTKGRGDFTLPEADYFCLEFNAEFALLAVGTPADKHLSSKHRYVISTKDYKKALKNKR